MTRSPEARGEASCCGIWEELSSVFLWIRGLAMAGLWPLSAGPVCLRQQGFLEIPLFQTLKITDSSHRA